VSAPGTHTVRHPGRARPYAHRRVLAWAAAALCLTASLGCAEKRDTAAASKKIDASPVSGAQQGYTAAGWKVGDATSWEEHMRTRAQAQNEYSKTR
jgi:hypothetical protein